jgi:broad specificity phosphatase PhoE
MSPGVSTLLVIRHGQATSGAADAESYDHLSALGVEQATLLGAHLAQTGVRLDALFAGPRRRQRDTASHLAAALRAAGAAPPELTTVEALDEYPGEAILRASLPLLLRDADDEARAVFGGDPLAAPTDARRFQRLFERVMRSWVAGELTLHESESFGAFAARVRGALDDIMARAGRGKTVAVVTSAGPTSIAAQMALELSDAMALKTSWVVANTGVTDIKWRETEMTLVAFNQLRHLEPRHITYR